MAKIVNGARFLLKRSTTAGVTPTTPSGSDHTLGWLDTDIYVGELYANVADNKVWIRGNTSRVEFAMKNPSTSRIDNAILPTDISATNTVLSPRYNVFSTAKYISGSATGMTIYSDTTLNVTSVTSINFNTPLINFASGFTYSSTAYVNVPAGTAVSTTYTPGIKFGNSNFGIYGGLSNNLYFINGTTLRQYFTSTGAIYASAFNNTSDINLKEDIKNIDNSLSNILKLKPVSFNFKDDDSKQIHFGLIAQDVEKIYPELVSTDETSGYKSVNYIGLIALLINSINEQQYQINKLNEKINTK